MTEGLQSNFRFRPTQERDLDRVVDLERDDDTAVWLGETGLEWHRQMLADPDQRHRVLIRGTDVFGFAVTAGYAASELLELRRMVVKTSARGEGVGRLLLRIVLSRAESEGWDQVWLDVKSDNVRAQRLYRRAGFAVTNPPTGVIQDATFIYMTRTRGAATPRPISEPP